MYICLYNLYIIGEIDPLEDSLFISAFTALYSVPIRPTKTEIWVLEECNVILVHYCIGMIILIIIIIGVYTTI